jgi:hypothetical protein
MIEEECVRQCPACVPQLMELSPGPTASLLPGAPEKKHESDGEAPEEQEKQEDSCVATPEKKYESDGQAPEEQEKQEDSTASLLSRAGENQEDFTDDESDEEASQEQRAIMDRVNNVDTISPAEKCQLLDQLLSFDEEPWAQVAIVQLVEKSFAAETRGLMENPAMNLPVETGVLLQVDGCSPKIGDLYNVPAVGDCLVWILFLGAVGIQVSPDTLLGFTDAHINACLPLIISSSYHQPPHRLSYREPPHRSSYHHPPHRLFVLSSTPHRLFVLSSSSYSTH